MVSAGIKGVHCVLFALWDSNERLDRGAMRAQVDWALEHGAEGIVVLGLATEVGKFALSEKLKAIDWAAQDLEGMPLTVTVAANSVHEQKTILRAAEHAGAALAILQPPLVGSFAAMEYIDFIARVGEDARLPLAVQNAPQYLGRSLSGPDLTVLKARLPRLVQVKTEMPAVDLAAFAETCGSLTLLNGRGGLEMTDALRIGCHGFIVAPDVLPGVAACWRAWEAGDTSEADVAYAALLPAATFGMQSLEHLVCYGKRIWGRRAAVPIHDRAPALKPSDAGLRLAERWATIGERALERAPS